MKVLFLAIILRLFSNPAANVIQKKLTSLYGTFIINAVTYLGLFIITMPVFLKTDFLNLPKTVWLWAILGGLIGTVGNGALIKALSLGDLSILGPINSYKPVISMLFGIFFLKELPNLIGILGIIFIILGSYFIFESTDEKFTFKIFKRKDIIYRLIALTLTAIEAVIIKKIILLSSYSIAFILWCLFGGIFSFILGKYKKEKTTPISINIFLKFTFLALLIGIMQYSTNYVFSKINTSYALSIFQLSSIITVFFGYKFFREKNILKKLLGCTIMVIGSIIIILN